MRLKRNREIWNVLFYRVLGCMIVVSLLAACKSKTAATASNAEILKSEEVFFSSVLDHTFRFNTLSARLKLDIQLPEKNVSAKAHLKMIHNDRISLSIQPLVGVEMFRVELTKDSVKLLDRSNRCFMTESYEEMQGETKIAFNFYNLQSLFTNNIFLPGENILSEQHFRRFQITTHRRTAYLKTIDDAEWLYTFLADSNEKLLSATISDPDETSLLTWDYSNFKQVAKQRFPYQMKVGLRSDNTTSRVVKLAFSKPEVDMPVKTDFKIPSGYQRITFAQIIQSLEKL